MARRKTVISNIAHRLQEDVDELRNIKEEINNKSSISSSTTTSILITVTGLLSAIVLTGFVCWKIFHFHFFNS